MGLLDAIGSLGSAVGGALDKMDPLPGLLEGACNALGLPKEVAGALKVVVGLVTEDYLCVADGGAELGGALAKDLAKETRESFHRPEGSVKGYAEGRCEKRSATTHESRPEHVSGGGSSSHTQGTHQATPASSSSTEQDEELKTLEYLKDHFTELDCRLNAPDSFDGLSTRDGHIDMDDLEHISDDTRTPADMKRAVRYLMDHPELYQKLARTDGAITTADLQIAIEDRKAELAKDTTSTHGTASNPSVPSQPDRPRSHGGTPPPGKVCEGEGTSETSGTSAPSESGTDYSAQEAADAAQLSSDIQSILNDPSMSIEEKIERILMMIEENIDKKLGHRLAQMGDLQNQQAKLDPNSTDDASALQTNKNGQEKLNFDIQRLVELRKSMFDLMSNIESKFHDMSNTAIQNMGRA